MHVIANCGVAQCGAWASAFLRAALLDVSLTAQRRDVIQLTIAEEVEPQAQCDLVVAHRPMRGLPVIGLFEQVLLDDGSKSRHNWRRHRGARTRFREFHQDLLALRKKRSGDRPVLGGLVLAVWHER